MNFNTPTKLTALRIILTLPFLVFLQFQNDICRAFALITFGIASLTDYYDGKLAREMGVVTTLGQFLDPLADKLLISTALIAFVQIPEIYVPSWMVVLIIGREFFITGLRTLAATHNRVLPAQPAGKFKTTSQITSIVTILFILLTNSYLETHFNIPIGSLYGQPGWTGFLGWILKHGSIWLIGITTVFTIVSGFIYLNDHKDLFYEKPKKRAKK